MSSKNMKEFAIKTWNYEHEPAMHSTEQHNTTLHYYTMQHYTAHCILVL